MTRTLLNLSPALRVLADHGVLDTAALHAAERVADLLGADDERDRLALALALRAPQRGHVALDLSTVHDLVHLDELTEAGDAVRTTLGEVLTAMVERVRSLPTADSPLLGSVPDEPTQEQQGERTPTPALLVAGRLVYTARWWELEQRAVHHLRSLLEPAVTTADDPGVDSAVDAVLPGHQQRQRAAVRSSLHRRLTVLAGGPGTGKTWTVARLLAAHALAADDGRIPAVALAAPTGKAAARLAEGVEEALATGHLPGAARTAVRHTLAESGTTLHRLLGLRPGGMPRHDRKNPLPHDVVVVDEASMVSLPLMVQLLEALGPDTRLVLVGDPDQLASVEAGTVLGDVVAALAGSADPALTTLEQVHRFEGDSAIATLATAVRSGNADAALDVLSEGGQATWHETLDEATADLRRLTLARATRLVDAGQRGDVGEAVNALGDSVVLAAHHRGRAGVEALNDWVESWLANADIGWRPWDDRQVGRPVLVTANDRLLGIHNGDLGVHVRADDGTVRVAFDLRDGEGDLRTVHPDRLPEHVGVHAMTIHKSQGSQWRHVVVVLPERPSPLLTRQLLYTAITRAREHVTVVGGRDIVVAAVGTPIARASGLAAGLVGDVT